MPGATTLINAMAQLEDPVRRGLIMKITNESLFLRLLHFIPVDGLSYEYGEQASLGSVAFRGINGSYTADVGVVNPKVEHMAILGGIVKTDHVLADMRQGAIRASNIMAKVRRAGLAFDKYCIDGDPTVIDKSFFGLNARLTGNQVLTPAADGAGNGGALALTDLDRLIDAVAGPNDQKVLIMCKADRRKINNLVLAAAGGAALMDVGKSIKSYDDVRIEVLDEDGDETPILAKDEAHGTSEATSSIYCIRPGQDPEGDWVQGIVRSNLIEHIPFPQFDTSVQDLIEFVGSIAVFHGRAAARLKGIL